MSRNSDGVRGPAKLSPLWRAATGITSVPVFRAIDRHGRVREGRLDSGPIARIIQRAAAHAGLAPALYASGRASSLDTVRKYIRHRSLFRDNPAARLGL